MNITVEVVYATTSHQEIIKLTTPNTSTILEVIRATPILEHNPELDVNNLAIGIYGKRIYDIDSYQIKDNDRIEIYRPLLKSPNQKRLERAKVK